MPANTKRDAPFEIGDSDALAIMLEKLGGGGHMPASERLRELVLSAGEHAVAMHGNGAEAEKEPEQDAFYHGLLTGYSVAMCLLAQQEQEKGKSETSRRHANLQETPPSRQETPAPRS